MVIYVFIEGGVVVNSCIDEFLDSSCKIVPFPTYFAKVFDWYVVAFVGLVFKDG